MNNSKRYITIYEQVREDIINSRYPVGSKLPSKRTMAESMGVSVITVEHAYELLMEEGYIQPREKSGYFVTYDDHEIYTDVGSASVTDSKPFFYHPATTPGDSLLISYSMYAKTVRRVLSTYGEYVMEKSPMNGLPELRQAITNYLSRSRRIEISPDQLIIGAGAEYLYGIIVQAFGRDIRYGIESPSYQKIARVYAAGGADLTMLKLGKDGIESNALWSGDMKVLHITPYRSFPSGVTASAAKKREYLKWSEKADAFIVEDDFESEFTPSRKPEETLFSLDKNGRVIYVNTFTKTIGSYVRTAYMVLPERLLPRFAEKTGFYECPVPTLDQLILTEFLESGDFERHINKVRRHNRSKARKEAH